MASDSATNTAVDLVGSPAFVRPRHRAILLTARPDGRPQGSPPTCGVDDADRLVMSTYPERWDPVATGGFPAHLAPGR